METETIRAILARNIRIYTVKKNQRTKHLIKVMSRSQVYDILNTRKAASIDAIDCLAQALGVEAYKLLQSE